MLSIGAIFPIMILESWQNALQESRPVNINYLIWIDIEHVCNYDNEIEFGFGVNYAASDSNNYVF